jgi:hypothetical protein
MNFDFLDNSLASHSTNKQERDYIRCRVAIAVGDECYWRGDTATAKELYSAAIRREPWLGKARIKAALLACGKPGDYVRRAILAAR